MPVEQQMGRYHLLRLVSRDSKDEVYLAEDQQLKRLVAMKLSRSMEGAVSCQGAGARGTRLFQHEANAIAMLNHPRILSLLDYGEEIVNGRIVTYMVMPFCKDGSLADWLTQHRKAGSLPLQDIARLVYQAADALQYTHNHRMVHQNIKPSSFLIRLNKAHPNSPDLLLTNFALARFTKAEVQITSTVRGTPAYMAPEQWQGEPVAATDQYALAAMAYEFLTGQLPFKGSLKQLLDFHLHTNPPLPSSLNPRVPPAADAVILRALAKKPTDRFPSIADFAQAFRQALLETQQLPPFPTQERMQTNDLHVTLPLSPQEASTETTHTLLLPNGRQVTLTLPAHLQNGQIFRFEGLGDIGTPARPPGALLLTIAIKREQIFDVFLCHNGEDKPALKEIGKRLREYGIVPWLDEWELRPGLPWQPLLEQQIGQIRSAAVFVGKAGIGPWQQQELYAFLGEFARRGCPVIPVLLSDAPSEPHLPLFLRGVTWVDFRRQDPDPIEQLIWGVTGKHGMRKQL